MPNFTYNRDIPDAPNNPSVDQPPMKVNTNSTDDLIDIDHYSFNDNNGGLHKQLTMINQSSPGFPNGGDGLLFAGINSGNSWPHWQNSLGTVLLTNGISLSNNGSNAGYTYLPGGVLLQFGVVPVANSGTTVSYPIAFTSGPYSIQLNLSAAIPGFYASVSSAAPPTTTGFTYVLSLSLNSPLYWLAIGSK